MNRGWKGGSPQAAPFRKRDIQKAAATSADNRTSATQGFAGVGSHRGSDPGIMLARIAIKPACSDLFARQSNDADAADPMVLGNRENIGQIVIGGVRVWPDIKLNRNATCVGDLELLIETKATD